MLQYYDIMLIVSKLHLGGDKAALLEYVKYFRLQVGRTTTNKTLHPQISVIGVSVGVTGIGLWLGRLPSCSNRGGKGRSSV